jgi:hypothetical protein
MQHTSNEAGNAHHDKCNSENLLGWVMDPEGNKIELWQPPPGS